MTEPRKKTKQTRSHEGAATKAKKKQPKQTAHRRATSDLEVHELLERLRKRWKRASGKERRDRVAQLLSKGCTLRGIAEDIHQPESVVRYYSKPAPGSPEKVKVNATQQSVPTKSVSSTGPAPSHQAQQRSVAQKQGTVSSSNKYDGNHRQPVPPRKRPLPKLPPWPIPKPPGEIEEDIALLRRRLSQIIATFIREKLGTPETPAATSEIQLFLQELRAYARVDLPWMKPVQLPQRITLNHLYEVTKPKSFPQNCDRGQLAIWLTMVLVSLCSNWESDIETAAQQLFPEPSPASAQPPGPQPGRPRSFAIAVPAFRLRGPRGY